MKQVKIWAISSFLARFLRARNSLSLPFQTLTTQAIHSGDAEKYTITCCDMVLENS